jgi:methylenetetrahydrofolate dehydrogenase (NADP+)/methenyltetrahydrofolate cyclohydrolase
MLIDGKKIRDEILADLRPKFSALGGAVLGVIWAGDDPATAKFIDQKRKFAEDAGVDLRLYEYPADVAEEDLVEQVTRMAADPGIKGIIVQLPLPKQVNSQKIIDLLPPEKDVDALGREAKVLSPVVAAVKEILERNRIPLPGTNFVVVGQGKLVGRPVAIWLVQSGALVEVADQIAGNIADYTKNADVVISGAGSPGLLRPEMIKEGAVIIDAGTSEQAGKLSGDADPACATKARLFTPVPGGVGPIVIGELFKNLYLLMRN